MATDAGATVRRATVDDLDDITRIYDQYIVDSHVSFDTDPWPAERRRRWWDERTGHDRLVTLVATIDDRVVGVAYSSRYRPKSGYDRSVETSIVLEPGHTGAGLGTRLYGSLMDALAAAGAHRAYAVVALPNEASLALHHKLGFVDIGTEHESGYKLGRYWSTVILEKRFPDAG